MPSEQNELNKALVKFQAKLKGAKKDAINPAFKRPGSPEGSRYADLESVWQAAIEAGLTECGLAITQDVGYAYAGYGDKGEIIDTLTTELRHESGQMKASTMRLHMSASSPQAQGSAITYARRYALAAILGIYQVDDDAQEAEDHRPKQQTATGTSRSQQSTVPASSAPAGRPPCPECGQLNLRQDKENPEQWYCWQKSDGCGYKGPRADMGNPDFQGKKAEVEAKRKANAVTKGDLKILTERIKELGFTEKELQEYIFDEYRFDEVTAETLFTHYTLAMAADTKKYFEELYSARMSEAS